MDDVNTSNLIIKNTYNMTKFSALAAVLTLTVSSVHAQDFTVLSTPEDVYTNSIEDVSGAKAEFQAVLDNAASTDAQKTTAMQAYMQQASPRPGYGFDMSFLLSYNELTDDNSGKYSQEALAEAWKTEVPNLVFGANDVFRQYRTDKAGLYMRVAAAEQFKAEASYDKFALYQNVTLSEGAYLLKSGAFVAGLAGAANLAAGETRSSAVIGGGVLADYSVNFTMKSAEEIKLGFVRNDKAGGLTQICFNNMFLYKVSDIIAITDDATAGLSTATDVNVQLCREFKADEYTPVCLPFIIENWRDVFADLVAWNNYADGEMVFNTIKGNNTQARKPYLVKTKEDITADNYLTFKGVDIAMGTAANPSKPGSWVKSVGEGEEPFPVFMEGNWAAATVPAGSYYLDGETWKLSDGTAPLKAFSAYMNAEALAEKPASISLAVNPGTVTVIEHTVAADENAIVNVYNIQGMTVRRGVHASEATAGLPAGIYIVNKRKVIVK